MRRKYPLSSWIEDRLRESLHRREAPEGFAERVMERIRREPEAGREPQTSIPQTGWHSFWLRFAVVAACVVLLIAGGLLQARRERLERDRRNAEQAFAALQLTAGKLHLVRARIVNAKFEKRDEEQ